LKMKTLYIHSQDKKTAECQIRSFRGEEVDPSLPSPTPIRSEKHVEIAGGVRDGTLNVAPLAGLCVPNRQRLHR